MPADVEGSPVPAFNIAAGQKSRPHEEASCTNRRSDRVRPSSNREYSRRHSRMSQYSGRYPGSEQYGSLVFSICVCSWGVCLCFHTYRHVSLGHDDGSLPFPHLPSDTWLWRVMSRGWNQSDGTGGYCSWRAWSYTYNGYNGCLAVTVNTRRSISLLSYLLS